jgi:hypothetical protein
MTAGYSIQMESSMKVKLYIQKYVDVSPEIDGIYIDLTEQTLL